MCVDSSVIQVSTCYTQTSDVHKIIQAKMPSYQTLTFQIFQPLKSSLYQTVGDCGGVASFAASFLSAQILRPFSTILATIRTSSTCLCSLKSLRQRGQVVLAMSQSLMQSGQNLCPQGIWRLTVVSKQMAHFSTFVDRKGWRRA